MPRDIVGDAFKWGFNDTVVRDAIFTWLKDSKDKEIEAHSKDLLSYTEEIPVKKSV